MYKLSVLSQIQKWVSLPLSLLPLWSSPAWLKENSAKEKQVTFYQLKENMSQMAGSESSRSSLIWPYSSPLPVLLVGLLTCQSSHSVALGWERVIKVLFGRDERDIRGARKEGRAREIDGKRWIWAVLKTICARSKAENGVVWGREWGSVLCERRWYSLRAFCLSCCCWTLLINI